MLKGCETAERFEPAGKVVGEEGISIEDLLTYLKAELFDFAYLQQNAFDKEDAYCPLENQKTLFETIQTVFDAPLRFENHDDARNFFLELQSAIKNMNFMEYNSAQYKDALKSAAEKINKATGALT